jgi:hypothetical protein
MPAREVGLIAQLEERGLCEAEAGGSNPPESIAPDLKIRCSSMHPTMRVDGEGPRVKPMTQRSRV